MPYRLTLTTDDGEILDRWTIAKVDTFDPEVDYCYPVWGTAVALGINRVIEKREGRA